MEDIALRQIFLVKTLTVFLRWRILLSDKYFQKYLLSKFEIFSKMEDIALRQIFPEIFVVKTLRIFLRWRILPSDGRWWISAKGEQGINLKPTFSIIDK